MKLNYKQTLLVGLVFFSIQLFWGAYEYSIPLILENTFNLSNTVIGTVMAVDNVLALFLLPLFGLLSDRLTTKIGRRTPFILAGTSIAVILAVIVPLINDAQINNPENYTTNLTLFIVALGLVLFVMGTYRSPAVALMPDVTIKPLRSKANAIINLMGALGAIFASLYIVLLKEEGGSFVPIFMATSSTMVIAVSVFYMNIRENKLAKEMRDLSLELHIDQEEEEVQKSGTRQMAKIELRSLLFLLASIFFWFMGYNAVTSIFSLYATSYIGMSEGSATLPTLVANLAGVIAFIPIGLLSQRIGRKKMILGGIVALTVAFSAASFMTTYSPFLYGLMVLAGVSLAAINVNSYPMVVEMSVGANIGKYTGYYYTASMAAQIITPIFSGFLIDVLGNYYLGDGGRFYAVLFPYATIFVIISFFTMLQVRHGDSIQLSAKASS